MSMLIAALLAQAPPEPAAAPFYREAVACIASAAAERGDKEPGEDIEEVLTWGFVMAEYGKPAGRTPEQVDTLDIEEAEPFYRMMKEHKPKAFEAHRAYCRALLP